MHPRSDVLLNKDDRRQLLQSPDSEEGKHDANGCRSLKRSMPAMSIYSILVLLLLLVLISLSVGLFYSLTPSTTPDSSNSLQTNTTHVSFLFLGQSYLCSDICTLPHALPQLNNNRISTDLLKFMDLYSFLLDGTDAVFTDFESSVYGKYGGSPTRSDSRYTHISTSDVVECLIKLSSEKNDDDDDEKRRMLMLFMSNNHAWDLGDGGILSAIDLLDEHRSNAVWAGIGTNRSQASRPAIWNVHSDIKTSVTSMASGSVNTSGIASNSGLGVNVLRRETLPFNHTSFQKDDLDLQYENINKSVRESHIPIVYHHDHYYIHNHTLEPELWRRQFAENLLVDHGVSVYVSHGYPGMQGIQVVDGNRLIFYDLGNFIFQTRVPKEYDDRAWYSIAARVNFTCIPPSPSHASCPPHTQTHTVSDSKQSFLSKSCESSPCGISSVELFPIELDSQGEFGLEEETRGLPSLATGFKAHRILDEIAALSLAFGTQIEIQSHRLTINGRDYYTSIGYIMIDSPI